MWRRSVAYTICTNTSRESIFASADAPPKEKEVKSKKKLYLPDGDIAK